MSDEARDIILMMQRDDLADKVKTFEELHEHVDANDYILEALGYEGILTDAWIDRADAVIAEVNEWLSKR